MPRYSYGGQALIEGVLMRGRDAIAVAFRHPDGRIVYATERLDSGFHGSRWAKMPFLRGLIVLYETLIVGTRWLVRSASLQAAGSGEEGEEGVELGKGSIALMLGLTLLAGVGMSPAQVRAGKPISSTTLMLSAESRWQITRQPRARPASAFSIRSSRYRICPPLRPVTCSTTS